MRNKKIKRRRRAAASCLLALLVLWLCGTAFADGDVQEMPPLSEAEKTLTVIYRYQGDGIEGVGLKLYQLADVTVTRGRVDYVMTDAFAGYPADWEEMTVRDSIVYAKTINVNHKPVAASGVTDADGRAVFGNLAPGMYLVVQTDAAGEAGRYEKTAPYLLAVPQAVDGAWVDAVTAYPKTELLKKPETPVPVTGDSAPLIGLFAVAGAAAIVIVAVRRKKEA